MNIAAYCRVSTGSKEQLSSLENQRAFFEEYAQKLGHRLVRIYADRGISGKALTNRAEFLAMLSDSALGIFDMLVVKDISRFARNTVDFLTGIRTLKSRGIEVRFLSCNMDTLGESEFALTVFAAIAQEESYNLSKRIMFGKKVSAKNGRTPPYIYGYDKIDTYTLRVNESEAGTVRLIFKSYTSDGLGIRKIAQVLNAHAIPTKRGGIWTAKTVRRILSNPIYAGTLVNNKTETLDFLTSTRKSLPPSEHICHERSELAIVPDAICKKARQMLAQRAKSCHKQK